MVNLVAERERISEEHSVRISEVRSSAIHRRRRTESSLSCGLAVQETRRQYRVIKSQHEAKQEIILRALQEESDLEALRREKRAIMEEEKRLKVP